MKILGYDFGVRQAPLIVAEIGAGHCGSMQQAADLIIDAARAGAGAVKLQTYTPDSMTIDCDGPDFEVRDGLWKGRNLYALYKEAMTPREWHADLFKAAQDANIPIFSTPFSVEDVDFLEGLGCEAYKIASAEINHFELLEAVRDTHKPVIISTGMASLYDIRAALDALYGRDVVILHCVSGYPTPTNEANLWSIRNLQSYFPRHEIGFSDHTISHVAGIAATALGARVIEKHIADRDSEDDGFACRPERFPEYVRAIQAAWSAMQVVSPASEEASMQMKRSIYAIKDIDEGETITSENVKVIRPGYGLEPGMYSETVGKKAKKIITRGTAISGDMIE